jgi:hypothetical protein
VWGLGASTHLAFPWAASALVAQVNTLAPSERDWNVMRDLASSDYR